MKKGKQILWAVPKSGTPFPKDMDDASIEHLNQSLHQVGAGLWFNQRRGEPRYLRQSVAVGGCPYEAFCVSFGMNVSRDSVAALLEELGFSVTVPDDSALCIPVQQATAQIVV